MFNWLKSTEHNLDIQENCIKFIESEEDVDIGKIEVAVTTINGKRFELEYFGYSLDDAICDNNELFRGDKYRVTINNVEHELLFLKDQKMIKSKDGIFFNSNYIESVKIISESSFFVKRKKIEVVYE